MRDPSVVGTADERPSTMKDAARVVPRDKIRDPDGTVQAVHLRHQKPDGSKTFTLAAARRTRGLGARAAAALPFYGSLVALSFGRDGNTLAVGRWEGATDTARACQAEPRAPNSTRSADGATPADRSRREPGSRHGVRGRLRRPRLSTPDVSATGHPCRGPHGTNRRA